MNKATLIEWQKAKVFAQSITTTTTATIITTTTITSIYLLLFPFQGFSKLSGVYKMVLNFLKHFFLEKMRDFQGTYCIYIFYHVSWRVVEHLLKGGVPTFANRCSYLRSLGASNPVLVL